MKIDYYKRKELAQTRIKRIIFSQKSVSIPSLVLNISDKFALSDKFVLNYLNLLEQNNMIKIFGEVVSVMKEEGGS